MLKQLMRLVLTAALLSAPIANANAQDDFEIVEDGYGLRVIELGVLRCRTYDDALVYWVSDPSLNNVGVATGFFDKRPTITLNFEEMERYGLNYISRVFWVFHECGHHALEPGSNGEVAADCFAGQQMARAGLFDRYYDYDGDIEGALLTDYKGLRASPAGHLSGPDRAALVEECAREIVPSNGRRRPEDRE